MEYCGPRGIPHSHFLGGPPVWTAVDRDKALWWLIHTRETCPGCGTRPQEWDEDEDGRFDAYRPETRKCWGCEVKAGAEASLGPEPDRGVSIVLVRNPRR